MTNPPPFVPRQLLLVSPVKPRFVVVAVRLKILVEEVLAAVRVPVVNRFEAERDVPVAEI